MILGTRMDSRAIINVLLRKRWLSSFVVPNYTPRHWWECDVFEVTKAGYFTEYEVKLTRADFKADATKARLDYGAPRKEVMPDGTFRLLPMPTIEKHQLLSAGDVRGPSRFFFVAPSGLLDGLTIPPWAGLIEIYPSGEHLFERRKIAAPKLHRKEADPAILKHAESVCYYRMHKLLCRERVAETVPS